MMKRYLWVALLIGLVLMACQPQVDADTTAATQPGGVQIGSTPTTASISALPYLTPIPTLPFLPIFSDVRLAGTPLPSPAQAISLENVEQVELLAQWGNGIARNIAWSPDGLRMAVGSSVGVLLYDVVNLRELGWLEQGEDIGELEFSPDGRKLAIASGEIVRIYLVKDGSLLQVIQVGDQYDRVAEMAFVANGNQLAIVFPGSRPLPPDQQQKGGSYYWGGIWNLQDGSLVTAMTGEPEENGYTEDLVVSQNGKYVGAVFVGGILRVWRLSDGSLIGQLPLPTQGEQSLTLTLSPDLTMAASGLEDGSIRMFRLHLDDDGIRVEEIATITGYRERVVRAAFSPDGQFLASGSSEDTLRLWRVQDSTQQAILEGFSTPGLVFSPNGMTLGFITDGVPRLWHPADGNQTRELHGFTREVSSLAFNSSGTILASGSHWGGVKLWRLADGNIEMEFDEAGQALRFIDDDRVLAIVRRSDVSLWELANMGWRKFPLTDYRVIWPVAIAFSSDGSLLAKGVEEGNILVWQTSTGSQVQVLKGNTDEVDCVSFSPDAALLASASEDGTVKIWNVSQASTIHSFDNHAGYDCGVAFSPDGKLLASTSAISGIKLWNVSDGLFLREMPEIISEVTCLTFSADGKLIAGGLENGTVRLWNAATGFQVRSLEGHTGRIHALIFSPDGRYLISASDDGTIRIWGVVP